MEFFTGDGQKGHIGDIDNKDDGTDAAAVPLPHWPEARLSTEIPTLEGYVTMLYSLHVEPNGWDGAMQAHTSAAAVKQSDWDAEFGWFGATLQRDDG
jgi:hypothetical protein